MLYISLPHINPKTSICGTFTDNRCQKMPLLVSSNVFVPTVSVYHDETPSSGQLRRVALGITDVSEERIAYIIRLQEWLM
jgi:hypothetical protein